MLSVVRVGRRLLLRSTTLLLALLAVNMARAELPPQPIEGASIVVEGVVREAFRSVRTSTIDYVYLLEVRSASAGTMPETPFQGPLPKPGDCLYVHAFQRTADAPQIPGPVGYRQLPAEKTVITAYLYPRASGPGWQFAYPVGFVTRGAAEDGPLTPYDAERRTDLVRPGVPAPRQIGVFVVPTVSRDQRGLQINRITAGSPADAAGLKLGDIILSANNVPTVTLNDLTSQIAISGFSVHLNVRRAATGNLEQIEVEMM